MAKETVHKILLTGGGTGGHITPLLAVAHKLKQKQPNAHITYVGERGSRFGAMTEGQRVFDERRQIFAGKFRRYHGESVVRQLLDVKTVLLNIRDFFFVILGFFESIHLLRKVRPDVILLKGGFVGMPVGLAAALLKIPFVTHDSDALPGLTNRTVARWARYHATGMPASFYSYPKQATKYVGVLVGDMYKPVSEKDKQKLRDKLAIPAEAKMLMITGGSNGSEVINQAIRTHILNLKADMPELFVVHQTGKGKEYVLDNTDDWLMVRPLLPLAELAQYSGAADVLITRAGANTLAEFGVQGKACIVVPNPLLTGGHQLVNARELEKRQAIVVVDEEQLDSELFVTAERLLRNEPERLELGGMLQKTTKQNAAAELADLLLEVVEPEERSGSI